MALQLGAATVPGWSQQEAELAKQAGSIRGNATGRSTLRSAMRHGQLTQLREQIRAGQDPLGRAFIGLRASSMRRLVGATYTPEQIVHAMLEWARENETPERIVDPGVGSGRFLLRAATLFPDARLTGIEIDPLASLIARANLAAIGAAGRSVVMLADYRAVELRTAQRSLFIGNPPYVRHHLIGAYWKDWLSRQSRQQGVEVSRLAGLHVHFFIATLLHANRGDLGAFITAAEWLDVNYGSALRNHFLGRLGGEAIVVIEPTAVPFPDAATTAAITLFRIGGRAASLRLRRIRNTSELRDLPGGRVISRNRFESQTRWSRLADPKPGRPPGFMELGELCRVHRGQATGANHVWIASAQAQDLPRTVLFPTVTRARELIEAGRVLGGLGKLRNVVDLPEDLDELDLAARASVERFLRDARRQGAHTGYLARHRRAWWAVGLRAPAPILATYMARRVPAFTRNPHGARHINIAHGLYPREALSETQLLALVDHLSGSVSVADGRTYAGGLTKFEPREMERLLVPGPDMLAMQSQSPADLSRATPIRSGRFSRRR